MDVLEEDRARVLAELDQHRERLVERMVDAIVEEIPLYRAHPDPQLMADLTAHVRANIVTFIRATEQDRPPTPDELAFVADMVEHRVAQGVPIDHVLHAFRIGQRVLWEGIMAEARTLGAGPEAALSLALPAMRYADVASSEFTVCYVRLEQELRASADRASAEVVDALSEGRWPPERAVAAIEPAFPVDASQRYLVTVVAAVSPQRIDELRRQLVLACSSAPLIGAVARVTGDELVVVAAVRPDAEPGVAARLAATARGLCERLTPKARIGVGGRADGVADVPAARREATAAARQAAAGGTVVVEQLTVVGRAALITSALANPARLVPEAIVAFVTADVERDGALVATAAAFVECDLNTRRTAERLFVHRNTIRYRLGRIAQLAGVDTGSPSEMFELAAGIRILTAGRAAQAPAADPGPGA
ncbi:MAG TPA: helix-turn-helix domain-containing protein [Baekduia sp.]